MSRNGVVRPFIIEVMAMKLSQDEALKFLHDRGFEISSRTFYRIKKDILESRFERMHLIAKTGYIDMYLEVIATLESIAQELWALYRKENNTFKKALILEKIAELQPYTTSSYDSIQYVMQQAAIDKGMEEVPSTQRKKRKQNEIQESESVS